MTIESDIIVVSGLPRSGTSLMMQMLERGGIQIVTDNVRSADADNPHGYLEFEQVKKLKQENEHLKYALADSILETQRLKKSLGL